MGKEGLTPPCQRLGAKRLAPKRWQLGQEIKTQEGLAMRVTENLLRKIVDSMNGETTPYSVGYYVLSAAYDGYKLERIVAPGFCVETICPLYYAPARICYDCIQAYKTGLYEGEKRAKNELDRAYLAGMKEGQKNAETEK